MDYVSMYAPRYRYYVSISSGSVHLSCVPVRPDLRAQLSVRAVAHTSVYALTRPLRVGYIRYMSAMPTCVRYIRYTYVRYV